MEVHERLMRQNREKYDFTAAAGLSINCVPLHSTHTSETLEMVLKDT